MKHLSLNLEKVVLISIIIFAFFLRFLNLSKFPVGFNADEASFGYDAYSILQTGKDQWGNFMPIVLKSFGDYKSPVYSYLAIPSVAIFGLTVFATRLPNVLVGTLAVLFVYLLTNEIYQKKYTKYNLPVGLLAAFFLAVNPWSVMMSRGAFEANLITLFLPAAIFTFIRGLKNEKTFLISSVLFGIALFTYHSAKLIVPMVIVGLVIIYWEKLKSLGLRKTLMPMVVFGLFISGMIYTFLVGGGSRIAERSITQGALEDGAREKIRQIQLGANPLLAKALHNKYQVVASRFINNYTQYFSYKYLVLKGAGESYYGMIPGIGVIYLFEGLMLLGLIPFMIKKSGNVVFPVILWLLIAPLPAALSSGVGYSGHRAEGMLPALQILEALGFVGWLGVSVKWGKLVAGITLTLFTVLVAGNFYVFVNKYFANPPKSSYQQMLYGNLAIAKWLSQNSGDRKVILSRSLSEPQIFIAFADKWNPEDYQLNAKNWDIAGSGVNWLDQVGIYSLGKYTVKSIDWKADIKNKNIILVGRPDGFPKEVLPDQTFFYPDGSVAAYAKYY